MRIIRNTGRDRVIDLLRSSLLPSSSLQIASPVFSLFAFAELYEELKKLDRCDLILPEIGTRNSEIANAEADRSFRNKLQLRWLARECAAWLRQKVQIRDAHMPIPQSLLIAGLNGVASDLAITGSCVFSTEGLGMTPGNRFSLIQCSEGVGESALLGSWFAGQWAALPVSNQGKTILLAQLDELARPQAASLIYNLSLFHAFRDLHGELDEESIIKSATGIRDTAVWRKLYRFQRDGVVGAIDKLERLGGCIIADSVGLGKTFEALAIIKYYELRNDRVLVLTPKRLRENWTLPKANDRRNSLAADRFHYDVLNHTDLSRDAGISGEVDLQHVNWGNYDLVVIDESHNFRNKSTHTTHETRYDRLMRRVLREGVKTRVLMLSATPVNNRLADLKNQIAFVTEGEDAALSTHGIASIQATVRKAQAQFNRWLALGEEDRKPPQLLEMLGFDYFKLLDLLTIARSRKHIGKYYGTSETGRFPERLKPINLRPDVDRAGQFQSVREINNEIRRLTLAAYAPLKYVLPHKQAAYDAKYSTPVRGGESSFRQSDRENSLVHLLRINILKRMESSVSSFVLTVGRQLADVEQTLAKLDTQASEVEEIDIGDIDVEDATFESLLAGRKVKVLLSDVDRIRWRQDLADDQTRLAKLFGAAQEVGAARDAKLTALRDLIAQKCTAPINSGNRKVLVFTAFADTARYLYDELSGWAQAELGLYAALVTGGGGNQTSLPSIRKDFVSILTAFSPSSKERPSDFASDGEIDLLIATDCVSEGQNLQDCDTVVNYDIHWNPVRIIQRFGRIDRLGSRNERIQLINFWPNMELDEYINLEQRVSGRMMLLDVSATGEENLIEYQSGDQMNDLEYRRKQLLTLQDAVIDLEDLSTGISIADLTLSDFRTDLTGFLKEHPGGLDQLPLGMSAVVSSEEVAPGVLFCLRAASEAALKAVGSGYPLAPHYFVHVADDGAVLLPYTQVRQVLDRLKRLCDRRDEPDEIAYARFDKATKHGRDMQPTRKLLAEAVASITGKAGERAVASLFTPGGTHAMEGELQGIDDFEVVAYLIVLPAEP